MFPYVTVAQMVRSQVYRYTRSLIRSGDAVVDLAPWTRFISNYVGVSSSANDWISAFDLANLLLLMRPCSFEQPIETGRRDVVGAEG